MLAFGILMGWIGSRSRFQRKSELTLQNRLSQISTILNALPQAAITIDSDAALIEQNSLATKLMAELSWNDNLPTIVDAAVIRVILSDISETIEFATQSKPVHRVQVTIAPLHVAGHHTEALVLINTLSAGSNRAEMYQRLMGSMAHELRTPLTSITGHVDIMNGCRFDEEALWRKSLNFIEEETQRLARLVEDFLSLSRLDRISLHLKPINLRVAAEEAISTLFDAAEQNKVVPIIQAPNEIPLVMADPDRIRQVFINLIDNAIKYAPGCELTVRLIPELGFVRVDVSDNGPGISPEDLPNIFEPFKRGKQATPEIKGTGLGLTIVRAILDQHQAPISVKSEVGKGTTFAFSLSASHTRAAEKTESDTLQAFT
jgi:signal transduction histidine kinase